MKFIAIFGLILTILMPANTALASSLFEQAYFGQIIDNVSKADSVEFDVRLSGVIMEQPPGPNIQNKQKHSLSSNARVKIGNIHANNTVTSANGSYTLNTDGTYTSNAGSAVLTTNRAYFNDNAKSEWYFIDFAETAEEDWAVDEVNNAVANLSFDSIKVTKKLSSITNGAGVTFDRYSFMIDPIELAKILQGSKELSESEIEDMKNYINSNVTQYGSIWINANDMLPHLISLHAVVNDPENELYGSVSLEVNFVSFNKELSIVEPSNAIDFIDHIESQYSDDDNDGLINKSETKYGSDPKNPDTDGDGFLDGIEVRNGYSPLSSGQLDSDNDTIGDNDEMTIWGTNRYKSDTDNDGYDDATEIKYLYNPNGPGLLDTDSDGLTDHDEMYVYNTDRFNRDTDSDGYSDGIEVKFGYNPNGSGKI